MQSPLEAEPVRNVGEVGEVVAGSYRIGRLLGEGGMATVHEAIHGVTGRQVAVKFLRPRFCSGEWLARFEGETAGQGREMA